MKLAIVLGLVAMSVSAHADEVVSNHEAASSTSGVVQLTLEGGLASASMSNIVETPGVKTQNHMGYNFGVSVDLWPKDAWSVTTGLHIVSKGLNVTGDASDGSLHVEQNVDLTYLEIPVMEKYNLAVGANSALHFSLGGYFAVALSKGMSIAVSGPSAETLAPDLFASAEKEMQDGISSVDFGARLGADYTYDISPKMMLLVGANMDLGLKNLNSDPDQKDNESSKTIAFLANLGLGVRL